MEVEAKRSLPPPPNPTENIRRAGLLRGKNLAADIRREIDIVRKFVGPLGSELIKEYDMGVVVPSSFDPQDWGRILENLLNPLLPVNQTNKNCIPELALQHARHITLIEEGLKPVQSESSSRFNIPWQTHATNDMFLYLYFKIPDKPMFLTITPREANSKGILIVENLIVAPNKKSLHEFWSNTIMRNTPNRSRDLVPVPVLR